MKTNLNEIQVYSQEDKNRYIEKNFKVNEFWDNNEDTNLPFALIDLNLASTLQNIRDYLKEPIIITSGFRSQKTNIKVGGVSNSYHLLGMAADIYSPNIPIKEFNEEIENFIKDSGFPGFIGGKGYYPNRNFVHIDTRYNEFGEIIRWVG